MESPVHSSVHGRRKAEHPARGAHAARGAENLLRARATRIIYLLGLAAGGAMTAMLWFALHG